MTRRWMTCMLIALFFAALLLRCNKKDDSDSDSDTDGDSSADSAGKDSDTGSEDDQSPIPSFTWQTDPRGDFFDSISTSSATYTSDLIDIVGYGGRLWTYSADAANEFNTLYPCGSTENAYVICTQSAGELSPGDYYVVGTQLAAFVPLSSTEYSYVYSMVWESDGEADNDWVTQGQYDYDLYQGADRWYELVWDHKSAEWFLEVVQVSVAQLPGSAASSSRSVIMDDKIIFITPASELPSVDPLYRVGAFGHPGNWDPDDRGLDCSGNNPTEPLLKPE